MVTLQLHDSTYAIILRVLLSQLLLTESISIIEGGNVVNDPIQGLKGAIADFEKGKTEE